MLVSVSVHAEHTHDVCKESKAGDMPTPRRLAHSAKGLSWKQVPLAPVVLSRGAEDGLVDRALHRLADLAAEQAGGGDSAAVERTLIDGAAYQAGQLEMVASPSLFGEHRHIVITGVEASSDALISDGLAYLETVADQVTDVTVVLHHAKGTRGKRLLDAIGARFPVVVCEPIKRDADKAQFISAEFSDAKRRATAGAVQALVEAVGSDLRELVRSEEHTSELQSRG